MTVVYLDSVFVLNGIIDYLLFLLSATLAGIPLRRKRYALSAFLGAVYAITVFMPGFEWLAEIPAKVGTYVLLCLIAFGREAHFWRLLLFTFVVACAMAGSMFGISLLSGVQIPMAGGIYYTDIDVPTLLVAASVIYLTGSVVFRGSAQHGLRRELIRVTISIGDRQQVMTALLDNGNSLKDPISGRPVLVVGPGSLDGILPKMVSGLLTQTALRCPAKLLEPLLMAEPRLKPRLLPYHTVGTVSGMLLAIYCDWAVIGGKRYEKLLIALSPNLLGECYSALWGGERGRHGFLEMDRDIFSKTDTAR